MADTEAEMKDRKHILGDSNVTGKRALIIMPEDGEISEATQMADVMRRAGINVVIASLDDSACVRSSNDVLCYVDAALCDAIKESPFDALVLPGGLLGSKLLGESKIVGDLLKEYEEKHRWIVAIGDAPVVLRKNFIGQGKTLTCHPMIKHKIEGSEYMKYKYIDDDVFVDGKIITCKGGPHTLQCALNLVHLLCGRSIAESIAENLLIKYDDGYCRNCCGNCKYCCREDKKKTEPDIAERFACETCCSVNEIHLSNWEENNRLSKILETEAMIIHKLRRADLKDLEEDRRVEKEELEIQLKEDAEELEKWKLKWQNVHCVSEAESDKYKREYVEQEEARHNVLMKKKYDRQCERHARSKKRQEFIMQYRHLKSAEIDTKLAEFNRQES